MKYIFNMKRNVKIFMKLRQIGIKYEIWHAKALTYSSIYIIKEVKELRHFQI